MYRFLIAFIFGVFCFSYAAQAASDLPVLKVGVLKFGTVNWELQVIKENELDKKSGFQLEVVPFAGKQATSTALHGGAVDAIVSDWIWVSRQRHNGRPYSFIPYSRMVGGLVVPKGSDVKSLADLKGKTVGIAGGPVDKSWLLFQATAQKRHQMDLAKSVKAVFGAPPLLSKKLESGELDAVITFWHYAARLVSQGHTRLIDTADALKELGLPTDVPMLGYVFANEQAAALATKLSEASRAAKSLLFQDVNAWQAIKPKMKASDEATFETLRKEFIAGIPNKWGKEERTQSAKLYEVLGQIGGEKLIGKSNGLADGTFLSSVSY